MSSTDNTATPHTFPWALRGLFFLLILLAPFLLWPGLYSYSEYPKRLFATAFPLLFAITALTFLPIFKSVSLHIRLHHLAALALIAYIWVSLSWSHDPHLAIPIALSWSSAYALFLLLRSLSSYSHKLSSILGYALLISNLLLALIAIAQYHFGWTAIPQSSEPAAGSFANKSLLAHYFILSLPLLGYTLQQQPSKTRKALVSAIFALSLWGLIITLARASYIAALTQTLLLALLYALIYAKRFPLKKLLPALLTLGLLILIISSWLLSQRQAGWLNLIPQTNTETRPQPTVPAELSLFRPALKIPYASAGQPLPLQFASDSFNARQGQYLNSWHLITQSFPRGIGINQFSILYPSAIPQAYQDQHLKMLGGKYDKAHNDLLQIILELGLPGTLALAALLFLLTQSLYRCAQSPQLDYRSYATLALIGITVNAALDYPLYSALPPLLIALIAGCLPNNPKAKSLFLLSLPSFTRWLALAATLALIALYIHWQYPHTQADRLFNLAQKHMRAKQYGPCQHYAEGALHLNPHSAEAWNFAGRAALIQKNYPLANRYLSQAYQRNPYAAYNLHPLAESQFQLKKYPAAQTLLQKHLSLHPNNARSWNRLGTVYALSQQPLKAQQAFFNALLFEKNPVYAYDLAIQSFSNKQYPQAEQALRYSLQIKNDWGKSHASLGLLYHHVPSLRKQALAAHHLQKALQYGVDPSTQKQIQAILKK